MFIFFFFLILSSLPENKNLSMRLFLSAVGVVGLEAGVVPVFWSDCSRVMNMYIYSVISIQRRARRLEKFVLFIDISLYQGSFSYVLLLLG